MARLMAVYNPVLAAAGYKGYSKTVPSAQARSQAAVASARQGGRGTQSISTQYGIAPESTENRVVRVNLRTGIKEVFTDLPYGHGKGWVKVNEASDRGTPAPQVEGTQTVVHVAPNLPVKELRGGTLAQGASVTKAGVRYVADLVVEAGKAVAAKAMPSTPVKTAVVGAQRFDPSGSGIKQVYTAERGWIKVNPTVSTTTNAFGQTIVKETIQGKTNVYAQGAVNQGRVESIKMLYEARQPIKTPPEIKQTITTAVDVSPAGEKEAKLLEAGQSVRTLFYEKTRALDFFRERTPLTYSFVKGAFFETGLGAATLGGQAVIGLSEAGAGRLSYLTALPARTLSGFVEMPFAASKRGFKGVSEFAGSITLGFLVGGGKAKLVETPVRLRLLEYDAYAAGRQLDVFGRAATKKGVTMEGGFIPVQDAPLFSKGMPFKSVVVEPKVSLTYGARIDVKSGALIGKSIAKATIDAPSLFNWRERLQLSPKEVSATSVSTGKQFYGKDFLSVSEEGVKTVFEPSETGAVTVSKRLGVAGVEIVPRGIKPPTLKVTYATPKLYFGERVLREKGLVLGKSKILTGEEAGQTGRYAAMQLKVGRVKDNLVGARITKALEREPFKTLGYDASVWRVVTDKGKTIDVLQYTKQPQQRPQIKTRFDVPLDVGGGVRFKQLQETRVASNLLASESAESAVALAEQKSKQIAKRVQLTEQAITTTAGVSLFSVARSQMRELSLTRSRIKEVSFLKEKSGVLNILRSVQRPVSVQSQNINPILRSLISYRSIPIQRSRVTPQTISVIRNVPEFRPITVTRASTSVVQRQEQRQQQRQIERTFTYTPTPIVPRVPPIIPPWFKKGSDDKKKRKKFKRKTKKSSFSISFEPIADYLSKTQTEILTGRPAHSPSIKQSRAAFFKSGGFRVPTAEMLNMKKRRR